MDPKIFLALTEEALLVEVSKLFREFFAEDTVIYEPDLEHDGSYKKRLDKNVRSTILPLAQVNMIANVTFHLMAQQMALLFLERPNIDRKKVFETAGENIKRLTVHYLKLMKESPDEDNSKGTEAGNTDSSGVPSAGPADPRNEIRQAVSSL
jgi:hypothetical protein